MRQLPVGKHIFIDEIPATHWRFRAIDIGVGDAVIPGPAIVGEQAGDFREIFWQVGQTYMLEHSNAGDSIELTFDITVILQPYFDLIFKAFLLNTFARIVILLFRQGYTNAMGAPIARSLDDQCTPTATDVKQALPRL